MSQTYWEQPDVTPEMVGERAADLMVDKSLMPSMGEIECCGLCIEASAIFTKPERLQVLHYVFHQPVEP